jgi:hypothetical protein
MPRQPWRSASTDGHLAQHLWQAAVWHLGSCLPRNKAIAPGQLTSSRPRPQQGSPRDHLSGAALAGPCDSQMRSPSGSSRYTHAPASQCGAYAKSVFQTQSAARCSSTTAAQREWGVCPAPCCCFCCCHRTGTVLPPCYRWKASKPCDRLPTETHSPNPSQPLQPWLQGGHANRGLACIQPWPCPFGRGGSKRSAPAHGLQGGWRPIPPTCAAVAGEHALAAAWRSAPHSHAPAHATPLDTHIGHTAVGVCAGLPHLGPLATPSASPANRHLQTYCSAAALLEAPAGSGRPP